jgi:ribonuclease R
VHITELGGDYFRFDEARQELRGERSGVRYGIGTRVRVQVSRVDLDGASTSAWCARRGLLGRVVPAGRRRATEAHQGENGRRDAKESGAA